LTLRREKSYEKLHNSKISKKKNQNKTPDKLYRKPPCSNRSAVFGARFDRVWRARGAVPSSVVTTAFAPLAATLLRTVRAGACTALGGIAGPGAVQPVRRRVQGKQRRLEQHAGAALAGWRPRPLENRAGVFPPQPAASRIPQKVVWARPAAPPALAAPSLAVTEPTAARTGVATRAAAASPTIERDRSSGWGCGRFLSR